MLLIAAGKTVSEIAEEIALSVKTVSTYRARILEKMNLKNNAELMRYVIENKVGR
jgi:DNA-binding NarL/FixJ family response regulator